MNGWLCQKRQFSFVNCPDRNRKWTTSWCTRHIYSECKTSHWALMNYSQYNKFWSSISDIFTINYGCSPHHLPHSFSWPLKYHTLSLLQHFSTCSLYVEKKKSQMQIVFFFCLFFFVRQHRKQRKRKVEPYQRTFREVAYVCISPVC